MKLPEYPTPPPNKDAAKRRDHRLVRLLLGDVYEFSHPKALNRLSFRARSEAGAWAKLRKSIQVQMFGPWALSYNPSAVQAVVDKCTIYLPNDQAHERETT